MAATVNAVPSRVVHLPVWRSASLRKTSPSTSATGAISSRPTAKCTRNGWSSPASTAPSCRSRRTQANLPVGVTRDHHRVDAAADEEISHHLAAPRAQHGDQIVEDAAGDRLV